MIDKRIGNVIEYMKYARIMHDLPNPNENFYMDLRNGGFPVGRYVGPGSEGIASYEIACRLLKASGRK